jgi:hypothetical protein
MKKAEIYIVTKIGLADYSFYKPNIKNGSLT